MSKLKSPSYVLYGFRIITGLLNVDTYAKAFAFDGLSLKGLSWSPSPQLRLWMILVFLI